MKDLPRLQYDYPTGAEKQKIDAALKELGKCQEQKEALERDLFFINKKIEDLWAATPSLKVRKWLRCMYRNCGKPTQDRFGGRAQCLEHVNKDRGVANVIDEFLHGKD